ncbi:hypothetical protein BRCON_1617 [Candidatus Sumerlaea chitinivorans]|uniref:Uncharacterized protein n=1 Tax=Sumerlaea chitinivorans TaxID=2250252 RepID=A0A2Z4Y5F4_SUMC1|nr:hypothetical protein BRCON_1617 [Candidatus Sumerlaea chitinivorans]
MNRPASYTELDWAAFSAQLICTFPAYKLVRAPPMFRSDTACCFFQIAKRVPP